MGIGTANHGADAAKAAAAVWLCLCSWAAADAGRILDVNASVRAAGPQVRLGELVADLATLTHEQRETVVAQAPLPGATQHLTLVELAYRLQRVPGLLDFHLRGPAQIAIHGGVDPAFLRRCQADLTSRIRSMPPWDDWNVSVQFGLDDDRRLAEVPPDYADVSLRPRDAALLLGSVALDVVFTAAGGERLAACTLAPTILRETRVLMVTDGRDRGHILRPDDLRETSVWVGSEPQKYASELAAVVGSELNRRLNAGELLQTHHLVAPICAERGEMVQVLCQGPAMSISITALALDSGRLGDTVRLRNTTSDAIFRAVLNGRKSAVLSTQPGRNAP